MLIKQVSLEAQTVEALHEKLKTNALKAQQDAFKSKDASHLPQGAAFTSNLYQEVLRCLTDYMKAEESKRRRSSFYVHVVSPAMIAYEEIQSNRFKKDLFSDPIKVMAWSIASQASALLINADGYLKVTTVSRVIVETMKSSYGMGFSAEKNEVAGMNQLIRTYLSDSTFLEESQLQCKTVVLMLKTEHLPLRTDKDVLHEIIATKIDNAITYKPMIVEPTPHKSLTDNNGGYITLQSPLVKFANFKHCNYKCPSSLIKKLNSLQSTPWSIDGDYLDWLANHSSNLLDFDINHLIQHRKWFREASRNAVKEKTNELFNLRKERKHLEGSPRDENLSKCKEIEDYLSGVEAKATSLESLIGKYSAFQATYDLAKEYAEYDEFFLPVHIDDRGRVYTYCSSLDFQGNKLAKSLVSTAKRERMTEKGLQELYIALGSCFDGFDKLKYDKRVEVVTDNLAGIFAFIEGGDQAILNQIDDDETYVAVRLMYELYNHITNPSYTTSVIVYIDSCSSAIQIQALLQHDKSSASLTNIIESEGDRLADAYKIVADGCFTLVTDIATDTDAELLAKMTAYLSLNQPQRG